MPSNPTFTLRDYQADDLDALTALFCASVHGLAAAHYDAAQRRAWAPEVADRAAWQARLAALRVTLALVEGRLAGFIGYTEQGHIDLLFSAPQHARQGVATALYRSVELRLQAAGVEALRAEASLAARAFFEAQGFAVEQAQTVVRGGVELQRWLMGKRLRPVAGPSMP